MDFFTKAEWLLVKVTALLLLIITICRLLWSEISEFLG